LTDNFSHHLMLYSILMQLHPNDEKFILLMLFTHTLLYNFCSCGPLYTCIHWVSMSSQYCKLLVQLYCLGVLIHVIYGPVLSCTSIFIWIKLVICVLVSEVDPLHIVFWHGLQSNHCPFRHFVNCFHTSSRQTNEISVQCSFYYYYTWLWI